MEHSDKMLLVIYLIKRVKLNFDCEKLLKKIYPSTFADVVEDCLFLENLGEDISKQKDLFIIKE